MTHNELRSEVPTFQLKITTFEVNKMGQTTFASYSTSLLPWPSTSTKPTHIFEPEATAEESQPKTEMILQDPPKRESQDKAPDGVLEATVGKGQPEAEAILQQLPVESEEHEVDNSDRGSPELHARLWETEGQNESQSDNQND